MNRKNNIISIFIFSFLSAIILFATIYGIPNKPTQNIFETESCYNNQILLKKAIKDFQSKNSIKGIRIETEEDYNSLLNTLSNHNFIKKNIIKLKDCFYRCIKNDEENIFCCIKHGDTDYASSYKHYKTNYILDKILDLILSIIGIFILKQVIIENSNKISNSVKLTLIFILLIIPPFVFASRPSPAENCQRNLASLYFNITDYYAFEGLELKSFLPGNSFKKLCENIKLKVNYYSNKCSYGLTFIQDEPKFYCCHHGNSENIGNFEILHYRSIRPSIESIPFGIYIFVICIGLTFLIYFIKSVFQKMKLLLNSD